MCLRAWALFGRQDSAIKWFLGLDFPRECSEVISSARDKKNNICMWFVTAGTLNFYPDKNTSNKFTHARADRRMPVRTQPTATSNYPSYFYLAWKTSALASYPSLHFLFSPLPSHPMTPINPRPGRAGLCLSPVSSLCVYIKLPIRGQAFGRDVRLIGEAQAVCMDLNNKEGISVQACQRRWQGKPWPEK